MDFLELASKRYSVRRYSARPVEQEKIDAVLKAAALAPTGCNYQPQRIMLADDPAVLDKIRKCTSYQFGAPLTLVICYDRNACWINPEGEPIGAIDASIVTTHILLEAAELGLGTCWVACFDRARLCEELDIPEDLVPVALLPMGYPAEDAKPSHLHQHRPASSFVTRNHF